MRVRILTMSIAAILMVISAMPAGAASVQRTDILNQGEVGVYAEAGAQTVRETNGLRLRISMPVPEPGEYVYPEGTEAGEREVFTLWAFVFNYPDLCTDGICNGDDLGLDSAAKGGVYNIGGELTGRDDTLTIEGRIENGQPAGAPPPIFVGAPLESPDTADVHLAVAPHGAVAPEDYADEILTPVGSPFCGCWWVAIVETD